MKLLRLVCSLRAGDKYPDWLGFKEVHRFKQDEMLFLTYGGRYVQMAFNEDYSDRPDILLPVTVLNHKGEYIQLRIIQDLKRFDLKACACDIAEEILTGNIIALNLRRYL